MAPKLSKSQYVKGRQCPKALWLYRHNNDLKAEVDTSLQARFDMGGMIGELAQRCYEGGVEVANEYRDVVGAERVTRKYINEGYDIIFEATAIHPVDGAYSRIDILQRLPDSDQWELIEVKSSTSVKDYHLNDMVLQYHVFNGAGYNIKSCYMMVIDNSYVRQGEVDPKGLFKLIDITEDVAAKQGEVEHLAAQLGYVLDYKKAPEAEIGARCFAPFECDYRAECWRHVPEISVYDFYSKPNADIIVKKYGYELGALPETAWPGGKKGGDLKSYLNNEQIIQHDDIRAFISQLKWPLYFLDYETVGGAIPQYDGCHPFEAIPFQFSLHIQNEPDGELIHHEFLHKERSDPRPFFAQMLIDLCGERGSVVSYNKSFEINVNRKVAECLPFFAQRLHAINERMIDLLEPFQKRWLYHPSQLGSASIKAVLPAFADLSYKELAISGGGDASQLYLDFLMGRLSKKEQDKLWQNLSEYCALDTYAMKVLLDVLYQKCGLKKEVR